MDMTPTITPKSDQLNADDLLAGPMTITVSSVSKGSAEQPVIIHWQGENGRPYKPSKSMRRVLVTAWGADAKAYTGRTMTIFREPTIRFGGQETGGIRISHLSDIAAPMRIALTISKGKREPYAVQPIPAQRIQPANTKPAAPAVSADEEAIFAAEQIGPEKARQGTAALAAWWAGLSMPVKHALKSTLERDWKPLASDCDQGGAQ